MKKFVFVAILSLSVTPAFAQTSSLSGSDSRAIAIIDNSQPGVTRSKGRLSTTASAIAPGLTAAGVHSCAGSSSVAGSGTGFGISFGTTYAMKGCERRANAASLMGLGQNAAALALLCNDDEVQAALNMTGIMCPQQKVQAVAANNTPVAVPRYQNDGRGSQGSTVVPARRGTVPAAWSKHSTGTPWRD